MWYYTLNGQQAGPISQAELAQMLNGALPADTLVWKDGMAEWLPAKSVDAFKNLEPNTHTPPAPYTAGSTPAATTTPASGTNPYAAPNSVVEEHTMADPTNELPESPVPLDIGFCFSQAWRFTTRNFGTLVLFGLVYCAILFGLGMITGGVGAAIDGPQTSTPIHYDSQDPADVFLQSLEESDQTGPVESLLEIPSQIFQIFLGMGAIAFALSLVRGQETSISQLFSQSGGKLFKVIIATILYYLMVVVGLIFLIIPGIYLAIKFMYYQNAIVDKDLGIIESLKYSSQLTRENKLSLFALGLLGGLVVIGGLLALGVGLLWAIPTSWLASTIAYCYLHNGERSIAVQS